MQEKDTEMPEKDTSEAAPILPHTTEATKEDERPPLYISGWGVMGQSTPDVATGSTPLTRKDD
jgi:hypothetical protein